MAMYTTCWFVIFLMIVATSQAQDEEGCLSQQENLARNGMCGTDSDNWLPCGDFCTGEAILGERNCSRTAHCCFRGGTCYLKQPVTGPQDNGTNMREVGERFLENRTDSVVSGRNLITGIDITDISRQFSGFPSCSRFPDLCHLSYTAPEDIQPPINIPYCQRIACRPDNPFLEFNLEQCLSTPGCAFDFELFLYRSVLSQAIMPGVPACHLAIRSEAFQFRANQYVLQRGAWNPLLTECLVNEYRHEIYNPRGCDMVKVIEGLGYRAKRTGWKNITRRDCYLLNGCWKEDDETCVYPLHANNFQVRSPYDRFPNLDAFPGKPTCLPFNNTLTNGDFLDAYHTCLASGCAADVNRDTLLRHLYGVATSYLPPYLQHQYWTMVLLGQVRADNWRQVADTLKAESINSPSGFLGNILPQNILSSSPVSSGGTSILPFTMASNASDLNANNPFTTFGSFGQFGNISPPGSNPNTPGSNPNTATPGLGDVSVGNFGVFTNILTGSEAWQNLQQLLSGLSAPPANDPSQRFTIPCPYKSVQWLHFPPLGGSFEGCCEQSFCYIPRIQLRDARSEIASYASQWSSWGPCSRSCGGGLQTRRRVCVGDRCGELPEQTQLCNPQPCMVYSAWTEFGACSASCGGGSRTRTRRCLLQGTCNQQSLIETTPCMTGSCPILQPVTRWSRCDCATGVQRRRLRCVRGGAYGCPDDLTEEQSCECGVSYVWRYAYGPCRVNCMQFGNLRCQSQDGRAVHESRCNQRDRPYRARISRSCTGNQCRCSGFSCRFLSVGPSG